MTREDFEQIVLEISMGTLERHREIMATFDDFKMEIEATKVELNNLKMSTHEALAVLKDTAAKGHSSVMDDAVAAQKDVQTMVKDLNGEIKSAIAAVPVPGVTPPVT